MNRLRVFVLCLVLTGCWWFGEPEPEPEPQKFTVTVTIRPEGRGEVILTPAGGVYEEGTEVQLLANPLFEGWQHKNWRVDLHSGVNPITITVDRDFDIIANFSVIDD